MPKQIVRPDKLKEVLMQVRLCVEKGNYKFSKHALERKQQRAFTLPDILYILKNGYHEKPKDTFDEQTQMWKYAIRGKTIEKKEGRVIVTLDRSGMLIITVIRLKLE
jgi:hypothetical protein